MSNSNRFVYTEISNLYDKMNTITGDKSDPTSIAGILEKINLDYTDVVHGVVGEDEMAIFGELGQQMLLNWENTSANFPNFVENFSAWSTLVAQAAGDYSQFEQQVKGIQTASPLGWASGGMQDSFITTSVYADALTEQEIADLAAQSQFYQLTGATYIDTGMVAYLKKSDIYEGIELALDVATIVTAGFSCAKYFKTATSLTKTGSATTLTLKNGTVLDAGTDARKGIGSLRSAMNRHGKDVAKSFQNTAFYGKLNSTKFGSKIAGWMTAGANQAGRNQAFLRSLFVGKDQGARTILAYAAAAGSPALATAGIATNAVSAGGKLLNEFNSYAEYTPEYYQTGSNFATTTFGDVVSVGGQDYNFFGQSSNGTTIYSDANGNLVYESSTGVVSPVTFSNGGTMTPATLNNMDENTQLVAGSTNVGTFNDLYLEVTEEDFDGYYDTLNANMERLQS